MSHIQAAWNEVVKDSEKAGCYYVVLYSSQRCYGGPEEGGWWYDSNELIEYKVFTTEEAANAVADKVREVAKQMSIDSKRQMDRACLDSLEWLDARGLDADFLPEPDGHEEYYVTVTDRLPEFDQSKPHYE